MYNDCCVVIIQCSEFLLQAIPQHDTKIEYLQSTGFIYKQALKYLKVISLNMTHKFTPYKQC
jgi:hypothetical protein